MGDAVEVLREIEAELVADLAKRGLKMVKRRVSANELKKVWREHFRGTTRGT